LIPKKRFSSFLCLVKQESSLGCEYFHNVS
jgi:hypothetical protein